MERASDVDAVASRLAHLRAAAAENWRLLRAAAAVRSRDRSRQDVERWAVRCRHISVAIRHLADDDGHHAAVWLATRCGKGAPVTAGLLEQLAARVCTCCAELGGDTLDSLVRRVDAPVGSWNACARRFLAEARVAVWVCQQNVDKGLAPSSNMAAELHASRTAASGAAGPPMGAAAANSVGQLPGPEKPNTRSKAVQRWRQRWRGRLARVRTRRRARRGGHAEGGPSVQMRSPGVAPKRADGARKYSPENGTQHGWRCMKRGPESGRHLGTR